VRKKIKRYLFLVVLLFGLFLTQGTVYMAFSLAGEEEDATAAENAGRYRQALSHYVAALQSTLEGSDSEQRLREKIIMLVQKIQPAPAVPEEVLKYEGRAEAAIKKAKKSEDYLDAAKEYQKAIRIAPWVASYYFNLGIVLEKAGQIEETIKSLKLYLLAAPNAQDTRDVKKKISGLEYEIEKQKRITSDFSGIWRRQHGDGYTDYLIEVQGKNITVTFLENVWNRYGKDKSKWVDRPNDFKGAVGGNRLTGMWANSKHVINTCPSPTRQEPIQGDLKPNGKEIEI